MTALPWLLALAGLIGLVLAATAGFFAGRGSAAGSSDADRAARAAERLESERLLGAERAALAQAGEKAAGLERERDARAADGASLRAELESLRVAAFKTAETLQEQLGDSERLRTRLAAELEAERAAGAERLENARKAEEERKQLFANTRIDMANSFEKVAAGILEDKSKRFTDHNRTNIEQLLSPLREKLGEFQLKVEGLQQEGVIGRTELRMQVEALRGMNEKLSTDANNLVKALKGSSKQQGDWGEVLLIGMLEEAGLRAGQQYRVQESFATEEGRQARPDIILDLPGDKHLVIDSKVSLTSYAEYCACEDEPTRTGLLERHARSLRNHIDGLNRKQYQLLHQLRSLDFVVMFVPIEPAYLLAIAHDGNLWQRAWEKDVLLVTPGTLFPVIRTIAHIWQQEKQTKNVEDIVRQAGGLYDKVALFAESFEDVGKKIDGARSAYDKAFGQLATGKGHVLGRISKLKTLGLPTSRKMPKMFESAEAPDESIDVQESEIAGLPASAAHAPTE